MYICHKKFGLQFCNWKYFILLFNLKKKMTNGGKKMISNKTWMQFCTFFCRRKATEVFKHTHRPTQTDTDTPVNVPQPACSSRWRDSAAFSSRTAEEPFLRKGQGGRGGVAKVNKLYKMELLERFEAPPPSGDGEKRAWRDWQLLIVVAWIPFTGKG